LQVVMPLLDAWPAMVVTLQARPGSGELVAKAIAAESTLLIPVIREALGTPVDSRIPVIVCPVALLDEDGLALRDVVSVCEVRDMHRKNELVLDFPCTQRMVTPLPMLSSLGGCVRPTAPSSHVIARRESGLTQIPRFATPQHGPVHLPVAVAKRFVTLSSDAGGDALLLGGGAGRLDQGDY